MASVSERLFEVFKKRAAETTLKTLSIGLGYTAAATSDGGLGLSRTAVGQAEGCSVLGPDREFEGKSCLNALEMIVSGSPVEKTIALATINALNRPLAMSLPEDKKNRELFEILGVRENTRVAMVGHFAPLIPMLEARGARIQVVDLRKSMGDPEAFREVLKHWAQAAIITSTAILNDTIDDVLANIGENVRAAMIGPSTPLVAAPFKDLPVHALAGVAPLHEDPVFKAVRHAKGTPALLKSCRKVHLQIPA